jgi:hypothetical protein
VVGGYERGAVEGVREQFRGLRLCEALTAALPAEAGVELHHDDDGAS